MDIFSDRETGAPENYRSAAAEIEVDAVNYPAQPQAVERRCAS